VTSYRLRGEVGGLERSYAVGPEATSIGSLGGNDIVLPIRGVSRQHARIRRAGDALVIEDQGSRNGVQVNGARVLQGPLAPGDEVRLGPVLLRLEEVPPGDAELAIVLTPTPLPGQPDGKTTTTEVARGDAGGRDLRLVDAFLEHLCVTPEPDLAGALASLVRDLGARGASVLEWTGRGEAVALAAAGDMPDVSGEPVLSRWVQGVAAGSGDGPVAAVLGAEPPLTVALAAARGLDPLLLVLAGDFPRRADSEPMMRVLVRLLGRFRPRPVRKLQDSAPVEVPGLVFPEGYVRGDSAAMAALYGEMRPLVQGDLPVLILGETGVGKEHVARIVHLSSPRRKGPFVAVNCAAIPAELLEAEMFGIGKGVATGVTERPGKFQLAQKGTLFLDEIGDMPLDLQAKLLRALQEKEVQPVGSAPVPVDIRVVAATNTDLLQRIEAGRFRRDLYYRVAGFALRVPPLRERREDVATLVDAFARAFAREAGRSIRGVTLRALRVLTDYSWPGNVRELEHEVRRLVYRCPDGDAIDSSMLSDHLGPPAAVEEPTAADGLDLEQHLRRLEERLIRAALERAGGNRTHAARLLGISRNGLALKMERLGLGD
jgi:DNA-binding NtrC family response regulator